MGDPQDGINLIIVFQFADFDGIDTVDQDNDTVKVLLGQSDGIPLVGGQLQRLGIALTGNDIAHIVVAVLTAGAADYHDCCIIVLLEAGNEIRFILLQLCHRGIIEVIGSRIVESLHGRDVVETGEALVIPSKLLISRDGHGIQRHLAALKIIVIHVLESGLDVVSLDVAGGIGEIRSALTQGILKSDDGANNGHALAGSQNRHVAAHTQQCNAAALAQGKRAVVFQQNRAAGGQFPAEINEMLDGCVGIQGSVLVAEFIRGRKSRPEGSLSVGHHDLAGSAQGFIDLLPEFFEQNARQYRETKQKRHNKAETAEKGCFLCHFESSFLHAYAQI